MALLAPAFLAGLVALAIPVLIHLIRRERADAVEFPSLMFLSRIPQPVVKRRRVRNWWLLALRCLVLILLVGAFARPLVRKAPDAIAATDLAREVVILLDRSYSMGYEDHWERATTAAGAAIDALGPNDRATLVAFAADARALTQPTPETARLRAALDTLRPSSGGTRYAPALKLAQSILASSELPRRELILITDMQRIGWAGPDGAELPAGTELRTVHIGDGTARDGNAIVAGVDFARERIAGRERVTPTVALVNRGSEPVRTALTFAINDRTLQTAPVTIAAGGAERVALQPVTLGETAARATVRLDDDALNADNTFNFVLAPDPGLQVRIVQPGGRDAGLFLRRALELSEDPPYTIAAATTVPGSAELARIDLLVLNDVVPDGPTAARIAEWVEAGGGLLLAMADRSAASGWSAGIRDLAGGSAPAVRDRMDDGGARLGYIDYSHAVFEPFRAPRAGAFGNARFYRYRALAPAADSTVSVLARYDDGAVALTEHRLGAGRVLVWGSTLDDEWTNLPLEPVFLPLVHQLARHAAGFAAPRPWDLAGDVVDVGRSSDAAELLVTSPAGERSPVSDERLLTVEQPGFYEVREASAGGRTIGLHAVNVDVAESELAPMEAAEITNALRTADAVEGRRTHTTLPLTEQERRQSLWWYLMAAVLVLLTAEAFFANRRSTRFAR